MTGSGRINSHTDLNRTGEARGNITVGEGDLLVNEKIIDWQTYAHHNTFCLYFLENCEQRFFIDWVF